MKKEKKKRAKRFRSMLIAFLITAIFISIATYAWFIGMRTVYVMPFEVKIATTDSLLLSLDGMKWTTDLDVSEEILETESYTGHLNTLGNGLKPISTIGDVDTLSSRMILFEKAGLPTTPGGYRLLASRVPNYNNPTAPEPDGYVAFDLFIKNFSGKAYFENMNILEEEAIYLTFDSAVVISSEGGVPDTGIENSVRVGFAHIGRVHGDTTDQNKITSVKCNDNGSGGSSVINGQTGICRRATIWEPNELDHVSGAIKWYEASCKRRIGANTSLEASYTSSPCNPIEFEFGETYYPYYPTYAVRSVVNSIDNIDIYDGPEYNYYPVNAKVFKVPTLTDSMKLERGTKRQEMFTLAPNSITKVRVYIWIEGQDIDNYDYSAIGKKIRINFGFTKERFEPDDIGYTGPPLGSTKISKPVITLVGPSTVNIPLGGTYTEPGYSAYDAEADEDLTRKVQVSNPVNPNIADTYQVRYMVSDWWGNYAETVYRTVVVGP